MERCTFVNELAVPRRRREEFLEKWDRGASYVRAQPGLLWTSLHESVGGTGALTFFTIAVWESEAAFRAATSTDWWASYVRDFGFGDDAASFRASPRLCRTVRSGGPF